MNKTPAEATGFHRMKSSPWSGKDARDVIVGVRAPYLTALEGRQAAPSASAAQNRATGKVRRVHRRDFCPRCSEAACAMVILGHSERRTFGETDETVAKQVRRWTRGAAVILCVGEYLEQREQGVTGEVVAMQTKIALGGVSAELSRIIIAYEPVGHRHRSHRYRGPGQRGLRRYPCHPRGTV